MATVRIALPHRRDKIGRFGAGAIVIVEIHHCHTLVSWQALWIGMVHTVDPEGHDKAAIVPAQASFLSLNAQGGCLGMCCGITRCWLSRGRTKVPYAEQNRISSFDMAR